MDVDFKILNLKIGAAKCLFFQILLLYLLSSFDFSDSLLMLDLSLLELVLQLVNFYLPFILCMDRVQARYDLRRSLDLKTVYFLFQSTQLCHVFSDLTLKIPFLPVTLEKLISVMFVLLSQLFTYLLQLFTLFTLLWLQFFRLLGLII